MRVLLFFVMLLTLSANAKTPEEKFYKVTIALDSSFNVEYAKKTKLITGKDTLLKSWEYERTTRSFVYHWPDLPGGEYIFTVDDVFGGRQTLNFKLIQDTSFVLTNRYKIIKTSNFDKDLFKKADLINIYYKSSGCFGVYEQRISLKKESDCNHRLSLTFDTLRYEKRGWQTFVIPTPVTVATIVSNDVIDGLSLLVYDSQVMRETVDELNPQCASTNSEYLFVLLNDSLFQFRDWGICDWDLYWKFVEKYCPKFMY